MGWDPSVLRKYSTTSHFRLLNQVRSELKSSPLSRGPNGELSLGMVRRTSPGKVVVEGRTPSTRVGKPVVPSLPLPAAEASQAEAASFRDRLRAIEMR